MIIYIICYVVIIYCPKFTFLLFFYSSWRDIFEEKKNIFLRGKCFFREFTQLLYYH
jgi:hypothetical protein